MPTAKSLPSYGYLHELMRRYQVKDLVNVGHEGFLRKLQEFAAIDDGAMEGYVDATKQNPVTVKFHWGHRHDFGCFSMPGRMGNHHIAVMATFIDKLGAIPRSLSGMRVLDVGCWTGGSSLLLCAMGAEVVAVEEVRKFADCARYLAFAFDVKALEVRHMSLYECTAAQFQDDFDLVLCAGVLHHLSDPKLALRIMFNCLKDGGLCLLETLSFEHDPHIRARRAREAAGEGALEPAGWNWMLFTRPTLARTLEEVGYAISHPCSVVDDRSFIAARRVRHADMWRGGLSVRNIR